MTIHPGPLCVRSLVMGLAVLAVSAQELRAQTPIPRDTLIRLRVQ